MQLFAYRECSQIRLTNCKRVIIHRILHSKKCTNRAHDPEIRHNLLIYNDYFNHYMPTKSNGQISYVQGFITDAHQF